MIESKAVGCCVNGLCYEPDDHVSPSDLSTIAVASPMYSVRRTGCSEGTTVADVYALLEDSVPESEDIVDDDEENGKLQPFILFLGVLNIFTDTALGAAIIPILPHELGLDQLQESAVLGASPITASIFGLLGGWLSDARGWRETLSWFYPLVCLSSGLLIIEHGSFWGFIIARLIAGMGSGFMYASNLSMIVVTHHVSVRATAVGFTLAGDLGSLCGPLVGGLLYDWGGTRLLYGMMLGLCVFNTVVFCIALNTTQKTSSTMSDDPNRGTARIIAAAASASRVERAEVFSPPGKSSDKARSPLLHYRQYDARGRRDVHENLAIVPTTSTSAGSRSHRRLSRSLSACVLSPQPVLLSRSGASATMTRSQESHTGSPVNVQEAVTPQQQETSTSRFFTVNFAVRFFCLFFCWGVVLSLQAILPIIWSSVWQRSAASIGLLFTPHLVLRVTCCAAAPFFSDITGTPLHSLISLGIGFTVASVLAIAMLSLAEPWVHSVILGILGIGFGMADSCVTAWAGNYEGHSESQDGVTYHGRAFAVLLLACDSGMFVLPLFISCISEYWSVGTAYLLLGGSGCILLVLSIYCGLVESNSLMVKDRQNEQT